MSNLRSFKVTLEMPSGASPGEVRDYIQEAVAAWKGGIHPDDNNPMKGLDHNSVECSFLQGPNIRTRRKIYKARKEAKEITSEQIAESVKKTKELQIFSITKKVE